MSKNSEYWEKRIASETWKVYNSIEERNKELLQFYIDASESVKDELYRLAEKCSKDGVLSLSEMYKQNRLAELNKKYENIIEELGRTTEEFARENMQQGFQDVYEKTAKGMGDNDFSMPNKKLMEKMMETPWRGDNFSGRLWKNQKKLAVSLNDVLLTGLQQGKTVTEIAIALHNRMGHGFNDCHRLVRTESMHYLNDATLHRYKDAGVEYVQIWAALDERTCDTCGGYHEKIYPIDKCPAVPLHANCRCTIIPVTNEKVIAEYEKNDSNVQERIKKRRQQYRQRNNKPRNIFGDEIIFSDKMSGNEWTQPKKIIMDLTKEYNTRLRTISPGANHAAGSVDMGGNMRLSSKKVSEAVHEFAHSISIQALTKYKVTDDSAFWKEIRKIRTKYRKTVGEDSGKWISAYEHSSKDIDEFFAEAFTHAKLRELGLKHPNKYGNDYTFSQQVLDVTNKYFGKSVAKKTGSDII